MTVDSFKDTDLKNTSLYLVGMMGAGKTTIGRKLATQLGYRFVDTDALIEQAAGQPISELFAQSGEATFRTLETQVLAQVSVYTRMVIATGGGIVTEPMNWSYLRHGVVIWLDVPVPVLVSRLSGDVTRPLLKGVDLTAKLEALLATRGSLYAQADVQVAYEGRSVVKTCDRILAALAQNIRLDPKVAAGQVTISHPLINPPADLLATEQQLLTRGVPIKPAPAE